MKPPETTLKCRSCGGDFKRRDVLLGSAAQLDAFTGVCPACHRVEAQAASIEQQTASGAASASRGQAGPAETRAAGGHGRRATVMTVMAAAVMVQCLVAVAWAFVTPLRMQNPGVGRALEAAMMALSGLETVAIWIVLVTLMAWGRRAGSGGRTWRLAAAIGWGVRCLLTTYFTVRILSLWLSGDPLWPGQVAESLQSVAGWGLLAASNVAMALLVLAVSSSARAAGSPIPRALTAGAWIGVVMLSARDVLFLSPFMPVQRPWSLLLESVPSILASGFVAACLLYGERHRTMPAEPRSGFATAVLVLVALYAGGLSLAVLCVDLTAPWGLFASERTSHPGNALSMPMLAAVIAAINCGGAVALLLGVNRARYVLLLSMPWLPIALGSVCAPALWVRDVPYTAILILAYVPAALLLSRASVLRSVRAPANTWVARGGALMLALVGVMVLFRLVLAASPPRGGLQQANEYVKKLVLADNGLWNYAGALLMVSLPPWRRRKRPTQPT